MGAITEFATSAPGQNSMKPNTCAALAETLKLNGYSTAQFGKCHEVPVWESSAIGQSADQTVLVGHRLRRRHARAKLPILHMEGVKDWERWLTGHHESSPGVWLMIAKKRSTLASVSYAEALEGALCHGWIDGQKQAHDSEAWLQKFTPRGTRSIWSKINREKAEQLIARGRMTPAEGGARARRIEQFIGMLERHEKIHP